MIAARHRILQRKLGRQVPPGLCALGIMTKAPQAGQVKTRLQPPLSPVEAAQLNICFLRDTAAAITAATGSCSGLGVGVYTPVGAESAYNGILPDAFYLIVQRGEAFGERLTHAAEDLLAVGFQSVCLIDSDSPTVPIRAYAEAVAVLSGRPEAVVFGPSDDGGYYLIGMSRLHRRLFEEIDWSTERVAQQTVERAAQVGLEVHFLPTWYDVDDGAALERLQDELFSHKGEGREGFSAPATKEYLSRRLRDAPPGRPE